MSENFNPDSDSGTLIVSAAMNDDYPSNRSSVRLSRIRLAGLLAGLSIAAAVALAVWVQTSPDSLLSRHIDGNKAADMLDVLDASGASYEVDSDTGKIVVPIDQADHIKYRLSASGLSDDDNPRNKLSPQHHLEREIARSIMSIRHIKTAKVILAIPEQTETVTSISKPSASVMINLEQGQTLKKNQKMAIIQLISASVPKLEAEQVTMVDQNGRLLSPNGSSAVSDLNTRRTAYKENLEEDLTARITQILSPFVDADGLRVQVSVDLDYSGTGHSQEKGGAKLPDSINKQSAIEQRVSSSGLTELVSTSESVNVNAQSATPANSANNSVAPRRIAKKKIARHNEVQAAASANDIKASLRRLSVAVVVDDQKLTRPDGTVKSQSMGQDEFDRFSGLVKQAIGFDSSRGDQLTLTHAAFKQPEQVQVKLEPPFWKQVWFYLMLKQLTVLLALLLLFLGIINPLIRYALGLDGDILNKKTPALKGSKNRDADKKNDMRYDQNGPPAAGWDELQQPIRAKPGDVSDLLLLDTPQDYQHRLEYMKKITDADARLVAEVIKSWINKDG